MNRPFSDGWLSSAGNLPNLRDRSVVETLNGLRDGDAIRKLALTNPATFLSQDLNIYKLELKRYLAPESPLQNPFYWPSIQYAIDQGDLKSAEKIVEAWKEVLPGIMGGKEVAPEDQETSTDWEVPFMKPLMMMAVGSKKPEIAKMLIKQGWDLMRRYQFPTEEPPRFRICTDPLHGSRWDHSVATGQDIHCEDSLEQVMTTMVQLNPLAEEENNSWDEVAMLITESGYKFSHVPTAKLGAAARIRAPKLIKALWREVEKVWGTFEKTEYYLALLGTWNDTVDLALLHGSDNNVDVLNYLFGLTPTGIGFDSQTKIEKLLCGKERIHNLIFALEKGWKNNAAYGLGKRGNNAEEDDKFDRLLRLEPEKLLEELKSKGSIQELLNSMEVAPPQLRSPPRHDAREN